MTSPNLPGPRPSRRPRPVLEPVPNEPDPAAPSPDEAASQDDSETTDETPTPPTVKDVPRGAWFNLLACCTTFSMLASQFLSPDRNVFIMLLWTILTFVAFSLMKKHLVKSDVPAGSSTSIKNRIKQKLRQRLTD